MKCSGVFLLVVGMMTACLLVSGAGATRLVWKETASDGKLQVLSFQVDSLIFGKTGWSAHVSMQNLSRSTIRVGDEFGVAIFGDSEESDLKDASAFGFATSFSPARPTLLKPGAIWRGVIGSDGKLPADKEVRYARVVFGPLVGVPGQKNAIFWVTNHSLRIPATPAATPKGLAI